MKNVPLLLLAFALAALTPACTDSGVIELGKDDATDACDIDPDDPACTQENFRWYPDADQDSFGDDAASYLLAPTKPDGNYSLVQGDCNDGNAAINPNAIEVCDDIDNNCNLAVDENVECSVETDTDPVIIDTADSAHTGDSGHTDEADDTMETDGESGTPPPDSVHDTHIPTDDTEESDTDPPPNTDTDLPDTESVTDTADTSDSADTDPETDRILDTGDSGQIIIPLDTSYTADTSADSDIWVDDTTDTAPPIVYRNYYRDDDGDGFGAGEAVYSASPPLDHVENNNDCDDSDPLVYRGAPERCNDVDDDCDGTSDDGLPAYHSYADSDGDGYGDPNMQVVDCGVPGGYVSSSSDCNDADPFVHPLATEVCNGYDDNCDGYADADAVDAFLIYPDNDNDGQGDEEYDGRWTCAEELGWSRVATDCDDGDPTVLFGERELDVCGDGIDQNCDGSPDNNPAGALYWYTDIDSDGYGTPLATTTACGVPAWPQTARQLGDCNDGDYDINPGAAEVCDDSNVDEDCDGSVDDDDGSVDPTSFLEYYLDLDGDGYGGPTTEFACDATDQRYPESDDCDDTSMAYSPDAYEWNDAADWNCDGSPWQELESTTATGQRVRWVEAYRGLGGDVPTAQYWTGTGPQPINFGSDILVPGASLPPGPTPWMIVGALSTGAGHNCARRSYTVPAGDWAIGLVHQFTNPGNSRPVVRWDGLLISSAEQHAQGQPTVFRAYGPVAGDGGAHVVEVCESLNNNGFQVAIVGLYLVEVLQP